MLSRIRTAGTHRSVSTIFLLAAVLIALYLPKASALQLGGLRLESVSGEPFAAAVPLSARSDDLYLYGIYNVRTFMQPGVNAGSTIGSPDVDIQLFTGSNPHLEIVGPTVIQQGVVRFLLEASVDGTLYSREYAVMVPPRGGIIASVPKARAPQMVAQVEAPAPAPTPPVAAMPASAPVTQAPVMVPPPVRPPSIAPPPAQAPAPLSSTQEPAEAAAVLPPIAAASLESPAPAPVAVAPAVSPPVEQVYQQATPASAVPPAPPSSQVFTSTPVAVPTAENPAPAAPVALYLNPSTPEVEVAQATGPYAQMAMAAEKKLGLTPGADGNLTPVKFVPANVLDHLQAAEGWRVSSVSRRSLDQFDAAEQALKDVETESGGSKGAQQVGAVLVNDNMISYKPSPSEAVLINFDKAIMFWSQADDDNAGLEFRRAEDRTRRAVERYASEIEDAKAKDAKAAAAANAAVSNQAQVDKTIDTGMGDYAAYSSFVIPAVTYVHALFESRKGDAANVSDAATLMTRVNGIVPGQESVGRDLADLSAGGRPCPKQDCIWVLVEAGQGPTLQELKVAFPVPTGGIAEVALPELIPRHKERLSFRVRVGGREAALTEIGNMNSVIRTEFEKRRTGVIARAVASSVLKSVAAQQAAQHAGGFGSLVSFASTALIVATTHADIRMWQQIPYGWGLARFDQATGSKLDLSQLGVVSPVDLPPWPALVYVKIPAGAGRDVPPIVEVLKL